MEVNQLRITLNADEKIGAIRGECVSQIPQIFAAEFADGKDVALV